ncbi:MAG: ABC transporter substrate-binding protein [Bauldia sp.]|nr:ABC transporter substrate-binding protein [Bauldia sp.]
MATRREVMVGAGVAAAAATLRGFPAIAQPRLFRIGVFVSETDFYDAAMSTGVEPYVSQMRLGLELAAAEINAEGGLLGRPIELGYVNDGGSPPTADSVVRTIDELGAEAFVSGFVQASPRLVALRSDNRIPVLHASWVDASYCGPVAKHFGPTLQQVVPAIHAHVPDAAREHPFSISTWTPSGRAISQYLSGALGATHTGDALVTTPYPGNFPGEYRGVMGWAAEMGSTVIWQADPRPYAVNVVNQAVERGLADGRVFAFVDFSEWQAAQLQPGASVVTCLPFIASDPSSGVRDFVGRAGAMASDGLVTHVAFTHYNAILALKAAIERSGEATSAGAIGGFEGGLTIETATGPLTLEAGGYATMPLFVATASGGGGLEIVERLEAVPSGATC